MHLDFLVMAIEATFIHVMSDSPAEIRFIANLWTLVEHPSASGEWTLSEKVAAVRDAGFDGINDRGSEELRVLLDEHGLEFSGLFDANDPAGYADLIRAQVECGSSTINVQLCDHDTPVAEAVEKTILLMEEDERQGANVHLEVHRDTCTETPEKAYAIADGYREATGRILRMNVDHSHPAIIKHLRPSDFAGRLLDRPELLQHGNLLHCRPFNGHHCQIPVTDGEGGLTREFLEYLPFVEAAFSCWLAGPRPHGVLWVVPELGPVASGYGISSWPPVWEDCIVAMGEMRKAWERACAAFQA
ncbi:MAG: xylose isomerase [Verrucomicrobiota bacterium]|nr:xylose isomerase [Verrucomicrobiota bacterium]